jgi:hypothetical protein
MGNSNLNWRQLTVRTLGVQMSQNLVISPVTLVLTANSLHFILTLNYFPDSGMDSIPKEKVGLAG